MKASNNQKQKVKKFKNLGNAAECFALDQNFVKAYEILLKEFGDATLNNDESYALYKEIANASKIEKNYNLSEAFTERALEYFPLDHELRFSLAYQYGEANNNQNAIAHYKFLCEHNPDGSNWNNIGVSYSNLAIKGKSVEAFKEASEKYDETLATANLAYRYINEGFFSIAYDLLNSARSRENYHENVDSAIAKINEIKKSEEESLNKILEEIEPHRKFRVKFAEAYAIPCQVNIKGKWESKHGMIDIIVKDKKVLGEGEVELESPQPLGGLLL